MAGEIVSIRYEFYFNPFPTQQELEAVAEIVMVEVDRLRLMFPPKGVTMKCKPTLLCAACYQEEPHHRIEWQFKDKKGCDRHQVRFLSKCINCGTAFLIPSQWEVGECQHCGLQFEKMARHQRKLK